MIHAKARSVQYSQCSRLILISKLCESLILYEFITLFFVNIETSSSNAVLLCC